ncbi:TonB-dependent receptor [Pedobacter nutrimenti]|uniref:TonB-dependent receptor n=1 Tax=Pedobacter nutrimenti TaxID=1241337 RepID=UPI00293024DB|nr:TonB-dependent receptor [Pedobacter nutrimenti]
MNLNAFHKMAGPGQGMLSKIMFVMRITTFLLFAALMQVSAAGRAQKITLSEKNASLKKVIEKIRERSGYDFFYVKDNLKGAKPVNVELKNASMQETLDALFAEQPLSYELKDRVVVIKLKEKSFLDRIVAVFTTKDVVGRIVDENGIPVPGASVKVKNSSKGTVTDIDGKFQLTLVKGDVLLISYVGFETKEITYTEESSLNITLKQVNNALGEVVVIGYGTQKKVNLTGSVASISAKEIEDLPATNITNSLAGRLPGLVATNSSGRPGSGSNLQIRGISTLNNNSTLIVVDGIVRTDGFDAINATDVASITILKDAASTAVYGARAANGVILITTKRGVAGKPEISYTGVYGLQNPTYYPQLLSAFDYGTLRNQGLLNAGYDPKNPTQASNFFTQDQLDKFKANTGTTNWYDATFKKNSPQNQHTLTVSGGNDAIKYFSSLGYLSQNGMYENINYKRYNFRSNVDARINSNLSLSFNLEGRQEDSKTPGADANKIFYDVIRQKPTIIAYWPNGLPVNTNGEHPVEEIRSSGYGKQRTNAYVGTVSAEQKLPFITPGLSVKGLASIFTSNVTSKNFILPYSMYDEDAKGNVINTKKVGGVTSLDQQVTQTNNYTLNLSVNYARTFKKHEVSAMLLGEQFQSTGNFQDAYKADFISNIKDEFFASGPVNQQINGYSFVNDTRRSLVGRVNYAFDHKYLLEGSFRDDGSFLFAPGKQWGFFPAVSVGWRISEEGFFKAASGLNFINNLKIRASKGLVGNDRVNPYQYSESYVINTQGGPSFNNTAASLINYGVYANPNITWEKQNSNNLGFDADLFNSKLNVSFDYFNRTTSNILQPQTLSIPATFGRTLPAVNYAQVKSNGGELSIGYANTAGRVSYNMRLTGSYSTNKVTKIDDPANALDFQKQLGRPVGFVAGYDAIGIFKTDAEAKSWYGGKEFGYTTQAGDVKYADVNGDGSISTADQKVLASDGNTPRIIYGLSGGVSWKGFAFNFLIQGAANRNVLLTGTGRTLFTGGGSSNGFNYLKDSWSPSNPDAQYPLAWVDANPVNNRDSRIWLKSGSYARLKSADFGYTFNSDKLKSFGIKGLRVFVSGTNLLTVAPFKEFDPEAGVGTGAYYPQQRVFALGVNLGL